VVGVTSLQALNIIHCNDLRWAEHTPSGVAITESLCHVAPTVGASLEDICGLGALTELHISEEMNQGVELLQNIFALTKLKFLHVRLHKVKTLPAEMAYRFIQLQELELSGRQIEYLPSSFTCCGAFPALIKFQICGCLSLVKFPDVDEGALPRLRTLYFYWCPSLRTLPLSLEVLTSLSILILLGCEETLRASCRTNCEKSSIWRRFNIQY
jgi:hypothetical protein